MTKKKFDKWLGRLKRGIDALPNHIRHQGPLLAAYRMGRAGLVASINGVGLELEPTWNSRFLPGNEIKDLKFVILAPNFVQGSAGIFCLYKLCNDLRAVGYPAAICFSDRTDRSIDAPLLNAAAAKLAIKNGAWAVYYETISGNPLSAKKVVRWVLNRPGLLGGDKIYGEHEVVFIYSDVYRSYVENKISGKLYMPTLDRRLFFSSGRELRSLECFYVGKSSYKDGFFDPNTTFEIGRTTPPKKELGKLFRGSKVLYCFDNSTALIYEAIACGCPVMIIPDGTQTWEDYQKLELGTHGVYWGERPPTLNAVDCSVLEGRLQLVESEYPLQLNTFIQKTVGTNSL